MAFPVFVEVVHVVEEYEGIEVPDIEGSGGVEKSDECKGELEPVDKDDFILRRMSDVLPAAKGCNSYIPWIFNIGTVRGIERREGEEHRTRLRIEAGLHEVLVVVVVPDGGVPRITLTEGYTASGDNEAEAPSPEGHTSIEGEVLVDYIPDEREMEILVPDILILRI